MFTTDIILSIFLFVDSAKPFAVFKNKAFYKALVWRRTTRETIVNVLLVIYNIPNVLQKLQVNCKEIHVIFFNLSNKIFNYQNVFFC